MYRYRTILTLTFAALIAGCQGLPNDKPAIHLNPNMDDQQKFQSQESNSFFEDNRSDRQPIAGTVAQGELMTDVAYYQGINDDGSYLQTIPVDLTREMIARGKDRFNIYCSMCHGAAGEGDGIITNYGIVPPPSFYDERIVGMPDGEIYSAIYNGVRTMPSYRHQVPVSDRWAIVSYIRTLQRSQNASTTDLERLGISPEMVSTGNSTAE